MKWATTEDTTWPCDIDGTLRWTLRYGTAEAVVTDRMAAAWVLDAYAHLTDPNISQASAIASLKRARRAARAILDSGNESGD